MCWTLISCIDPFRSGIWKKIFKFVPEINWANLMFQGPAVWAGCWFSVDPFIFVRLLHRPSSCLRHERNKLRLLTNVKMPTKIVYKVITRWRHASHMHSVKIETIKIVVCPDKLRLWAAQVFWNICDKLREFIYHCIYIERLKSKKNAWAI